MTHHAALLLLLASVTQAQDSNFAIDINRNKFNNVLIGIDKDSIEWCNSIGMATTLVKIGGILYQIEYPTNLHEIEINSPWSDIELIFKQHPGYVISASQTHAKKVMITLTNGVIVRSQEPEIDEIERLIKTSGNKAIHYATE